MKVQKILMVAVVLVAVRGEAAVTFTPTSPTAQDTITAHIDVMGGCGNTVATSIAGNAIRTDILQHGCAFGPPPFTINIGTQFEPVAPGVYTYDVYIDVEHTGLFLDSRHTIVVAPPVPALDE